MSGDALPGAGPQVVELPVQARLQLGPLVVAFLADLELRSG